MKELRNWRTSPSVGVQADFTYFRMLLRRLLLPFVHWICLQHRTTNKHLILPANTRRKWLSLEWVEWVVGVAFAGEVFELPTVWFKTTGFLYKFERYSNTPGKTMHIQMLKNNTSWKSKSSLHDGNVLFSHPLQKWPYFSWTLSHKAFASFKLLSTSFAESTKNHSPISCLEVCTRCTWVWSSGGHPNV